MRKVIPKNIADEMTKPYIDDAVEKQIEAADVPPRNKLNISFENAGRIDDNKEYKSNQEAYEKNHGKLYDMTHKNTIPWKNYVVYIVLLSLLTCVFTFSKYLSAADASTTTVVASFDVQVDASVDANKIDIKPIPSSSLLSGGNLLFDGENDAAKTIQFEIKNYSSVSVDIALSKSSSSDSKCIVDISLDKTMLGYYSGAGNPPTAIATITVFPPSDDDLNEDEQPDGLGYVSAGTLKFDLIASQHD